MSNLPYSGRPTTASLELAASRGDARHVRRALRDPRCAGAVDPNWAIIQHGVLRGRAEVLEAALKYAGDDRLDLGVRDAAGNAALHRAVVCANPDAVKGDSVFAGRSHGH